MANSSETTLAYHDLLSQIQDAGELLSELYTEPAHFIYELLQNAEDEGAKFVLFNLYHDHLEVQHDGELFDDDDVRSICRLIGGTKKGEPGKIGKFGVGFKSVYAYTRTPEIHSGTKHFCIKQYIQREDVPIRHVPDDQTLFILPFDHPKVSPAEAFQQISSRLGDLSPRTILFLRSVQAVGWNVEKGVGGSHLRDTRLEGPCRIETITAESRDRKTDERWLVFERPVAPEVSEKLRVEVAYRLEDVGNPPHDRIAPVEPSHLVAFFPTERDTQLKFLIQGPYKTTPGRDNILSGDADNQRLIRETAKLVVDSLLQIKKLELLTVDFLNLLPTKMPTDSTFLPVFEAVCDALRQCDLLPAYGGGFVAGKHGRLAGSGDLCKLLTSRQLSSLLDTRARTAWLSDEITESGRHKDLWRYLRQDVHVEEVRPETLASRLTASFLGDQSDEWMASFYAFLLGQRALWEPSRYSWQTPGPLRGKPFIRLQDRTHVMPFRDDGSANAYLPGSDSSEFPTVRREIAANERARTFLTDLGLREPDVLAEVVEKILPRYHDSGCIEVSPEEHEQHIHKILRALDISPAVQREQLVAKLKETDFLSAVNDATGQVAYAKPPSLYIRSDDLEMYFDGNPAVWFLDDARGNERRFCELGVDTSVSISYTPPNREGYVIIQDISWGPHERGLDGFDPAFVIHGLDHALDHPTEARSAYVWNALLLPHIQRISGLVESSRYRQFTTSTKEQQFSKSGALVVAKAWLPGLDGRFHKPSELSLDDLPPAYNRSQALATKLGIMPTVLGTLAEEAGVKLEHLELLRLYPDEFDELAEKLIARHRGGNGQHRADMEPGRPDFIDSFQEQFSRGSHNDDIEEHPSPGPVPDPSRRRERLGDEIARARSDEPPKAQRFRRVSTIRWEAKDSRVREFLRIEYNGECQICGHTFRKRDGEPYFEGLYLVSHTQAGWIDRPGNVLCLCPTCCAKFMYGTVEAHDIKGQVEEVLMFREGGSGDPVLHILLCGRAEKIRFSERHMIDLQELLKASSNGQ
jgi:hypothetical protein